MDKITAATNLRDCLFATEAAMSDAKTVHEEHSDDACYHKRDGHLIAAEAMLEAAHKQMALAAECDPDISEIGSK